MKTKRSESRSRPSRGRARTRATAPVPVPNGSAIPVAVAPAQAESVGSPRQLLDSGRNNVLTASRMSTAMQCLRKHYWANEVGLVKDQVSIALRMGSAWARAMEARWNGADFEHALAAAVPVGIELNEYECSKLSALLAAYYDIYNPSNEIFGNIHPEVQFERVLGHGFKSMGKIDGLGSFVDERSGIVESKTTKDRLDSGSDYWLRLNFNIQIYQYAVEARLLGWDVAAIYYDVTRKPGLKPKMIAEKDDQGRKIVYDSEGKRVFTNRLDERDQPIPRMTEDKEKGFLFRTRLETPDEYCDRLYKDIHSRPEFYFARKEVPIIEQQLEAFEYQRLAIAKMILHLREGEEQLERPEDAWPRNVSTDTCKFCQFKSFCLNNTSVDPQRPPEGFRVQPFNPELEKEKGLEDDTETADEQATDAAA